MHEAVDVSITYLLAQIGLIIFALKGVGIPYVACTVVFVLTLWAVHDPIADP